MIPLYIVIHSFHILFHYGLSEDTTFFVIVICHSLSFFVIFSFFDIGMKTDLFQSCGHC